MASFPQSNSQQKIPTMPLDVAAWDDMKGLAIFAPRAQPPAGSTDPSYAFSQGQLVADGCWASITPNHNEFSALGSDTIDQGNLVAFPWTGPTPGANVPVLGNQHHVPVDDNAFPQHVDLLEGAFDWTFLDGLAAPMTDHADFTSMPPPATFQALLPAHNNFQPIAPAPQSGSGVNSQQSIVETRITCTARGCSKTFRRAGDCRRHMKKHQAPTYNCIDVGCDKKFYRMDKLRDHLRQGHKLNL